MDGSWGSPPTGAPWCSYFANGVLFQLGVSQAIVQRPAEGIMFREFFLSTGLCILTPYSDWPALTATSRSIPK